MSEEDDCFDSEADAHFEMERHKEKEAEENCDHEWKWHQNPSTPSGPAEWIKYCGRCGMEYPGSWVEE